MPVMSGIIRSHSTRSKGSPRSRIASASAADAAETTSCSDSSERSMARLTSGSSSMISTRGTQVTAAVRGVAALDGDLGHRACAGGNSTRNALPRPHFAFDHDLAAE